VLELFAGEHRRVLRPGGLVVYTARTTADAHCGTGTSRGDDIVEYGGFIVHFFDQSLVDRLAAGFELVTTQPRVIRLQGVHDVGRRLLVPDSAL